MQDYLGKKSKDLDRLEEEYDNGKGGTREWNRLKEAFNDYMIVENVVISICKCPDDAYIRLPNLAVLFGMEPSKLLDIYMRNEETFRYGYAGIMSGKEVRHSNWKYILIKRDVLDREGYESDSKSDYLEVVDAKDAFITNNQQVYFTRAGIFKMAYLVPQIGVPKSIVDGFELAKENN